MKQPQTILLFWRTPGVISKFKVQWLEYYLEKFREFYSLDIVILRVVIINKSEDITYF